MTPVAVGHEIRRVVTAAGVDDNVHVSAEGFGMPRSWLEAIVTVGFAALHGASLYVAYDHGVPVTAGLGIRTGRTIGVYAIATVPAARRRGRAAAMTMRIVDDGAAEGCEVAILQASEVDGAPGGCRARRNNTIDAPCAGVTLVDHDHASPWPAPRVRVPGTRSTYPRRRSVSRGGHDANQRRPGWRRRTGEPSGADRGACASAR